MQPKRKRSMSSSFPSDEHIQHLQIQQQHHEQQQQHITHKQNSRRSLPKSRTGCRTCKTRKIKCDEQKPSCRNCIKHGVECDFLAAITSVGGIYDSPGSSSGNPVPELNLLDLELLHNFTTATYSTLANDVAIQNFYRINIVQVGLHCEYVMRCILALSALHLAHYRSERKEYYVSQALLHHQLASRQAMNQMGNPTKDNVESLFVFSVLTLYFALASPRRPGEMLLIGESSFPDWMFLFPGTRVLYPLLGEEHYSGTLAPLFRHGKRRWQMIYNKSPDSIWTSKPTTEQQKQKQQQEQQQQQQQQQQNQPQNQDYNSPYQPTPTPDSSTTATTSTTTGTGTTICDSATPSRTQTPMPTPSTAATPTATSAPLALPAPAAASATPAANTPTTHPSTLPHLPPDPADPETDPQAHLSHLQDLVYQYVSDASLVEIYTHAINELRPLIALFFPSPIGALKNPSLHTTTAGSAPYARPSSSIHPPTLDITDAFVWIYSLTDTFLPLLREPNRTQEAVAIFVYFCLLLTKLGGQGQWWLQGWGEHLIRRAWEMLDNEHRLWVRWPVEVTGLVLD